MDMYFDVEVAYLDPRHAELMQQGKRAPDPRPENCKIITAQYQLIKEDGSPKGSLQVFKEWDSSEEAIIRKMASIINPHRKWEFIPVGHNIYFDLSMLKDRAALYGLNYSNWFMYNDLPSIDIKHICVGMNAFQLKDSGLDKFCGKETSGRDIPIWYQQKEYGKILDYVQKEAKEFVEFYAKLRRTLPEFRKREGFVAQEKPKD